MLGPAYALLGALLFGINGSATKVVVAAGLDPAHVTLLRLVGTVLIAGTVLLITDRGQFRISWRDALQFTLLGVVGLALVQFFYAVAISRLPVGIALLFEYTSIVIVALWAALVFKEKVHRMLWWGIVLVVAGLMLVAQVWDVVLDPWGVAAGLGAAFSFAFYFLAGEHHVATRSPVAVSFWAGLFAAVIWAVPSRAWTIDFGLLGDSVSLTGALADVHLPLWLLMAWIASLGGFLPFFLIFLALRHISATLAGLVSVSEVLFAFVIAYLWLGETLLTVQLIGTALVFTGIVLAQFSRRAPAPSPAVADAAPLAEEAIEEARHDGVAEPRGGA